jgi:hypothetical protein
MARGSLVVFRDGERIDFARRRSRPAARSRGHARLSA